MNITANGPTGALLALGNVDAEIYGVRVRRVGSGRDNSNVTGHGETSMTICYVDGKRSTRRAALSRLTQHIADGERVEIEGELDDGPFKITFRP